MRHSLTVKKPVKSLPTCLARALLLITLLALASACGNKGPLYLPGDQAVAPGVTDPADSTAEEDDDGEPDEL